MNATHPLRIWRDENRVSLAKLAVDAKTTRQSLFRIEQGTQTPSLDLISRLTAATNGAVTANDFMKPLEAHSENAA